MLEEILQFDQSLTLAINGSESSIMDSIMMIITSTITWIPLGLFLLWHIYKNYGPKTLLFVVLAIALCVILADSVSSGIFKPLVARWRPARDPDIMYMVDVVNGYRGGRYGFFSSHAANTMSVAIFFIMFFRNRLITVLLITWSLLNCWSRVYLGVHYVGDITVGLIWGSIVGFVVYYFFKRIGGENASKESYPVAVACMVTYVSTIVLAPFLAM